MRLAILATALAAAAADVDETQFRYTRTLAAPSGDVVRFEPDGPMYGHARPDFPDLRIIDANGEQVPWRFEPKPQPLVRQAVPLVARGRLEGVVSVVLDRGAAGPAIDRVELRIPDRVFVGSVVVKGSSTGAEGSYATLSTTPIYSVRGAVAARSTTAVFPGTDFRYLLVRARGVSQITGATVTYGLSEFPVAPVAASSRRRDTMRATIVTLDLGYTGVPVDSLRVRSSTPRYVRELNVEGSNNGAAFTPLGGGKIARFRGVDLSTVKLAGRHRFLRVTIRNGDDAPLEMLEVIAEAQARPVLLAEGHQPPYRLLYGSATVPAPAYDFARLPAAATGFESAREGILGAEAANELFEPPGDTRTFFERNDYVIEVLLVVATVVVAAGGVLALRRRTSAPDT